MGPPVGLNWNYGTELFTAFLRNAEFVLHTNTNTHTAQKDMRIASKHYGQQKFPIVDEKLDEIILLGAVKCTYSSKPMIYGPL